MQISTELLYRPGFIMVY